MCLKVVVTQELIKIEILLKTISPNLNLIHCTLQHQLSFVLHWCVSTLKTIEIYMIVANFSVLFFYV